MVLVWVVWQCKSQMAQLDNPVNLHEIYHSWMIDLVTTCTSGDDSHVTTLGMIMVNAINLKYIQCNTIDVNVLVFRPTYLIKLIVFDLVVEIQVTC